VRMTFFSGSIRVVLLLQKFCNLKKKVKITSFIYRIDVFVLEVWLQCH
jgi:hypothetical protein